MMAILAGKPGIRFIRLGRACHSRVHEYYDGCWDCGRRNLDEMLMHWEVMKQNAKPDRRADGIVLMFGPGAYCQFGVAPIGKPVTVRGATMMLRMLAAAKARMGA